MAQSRTRAQGIYQPHTPVLPPHSDPPCFLFDNGSLRPESTRRLRKTAEQLQAALGVPVRAVSLLHSNAVPAQDLDGVPAQLLEPALGALLAGGASDVVLLPLFFGPSAALTDYLPRRLKRVRNTHPAMCVRLGRCVVDPVCEGDTRIASILAANTRAVIAARALEHAAVVLVDHGSVQREVVAVRDHLSRQLGSLLDGAVARVTAASMEGRVGAKYAFSGPLLAAVLDQSEFHRGSVVVALQFFSPGRHAGLHGDVAGICAAAERAHPGLKTYLTELIGADPLLVDVLCDRYREARNRAPF
jgi:sirohydrochlorin ferrochelatase